MPSRRASILQASGFDKLSNLQDKKDLRKAQAAEELRKVRERFYQTPEGGFYNPYTEESRVDPNVSKSRKRRSAREHALAQELINLRHTNAMKLEQQKGRRMPASARKEYNRLHGLVEGAQATADQGQRLTAEGKEYVNPLMDSIASVLPAQVEQGLFSMALDPDEKSQRQLMSRFIAGIRKSELGAALTQFEAKMGAAWDPLAPGISQADSNMRFQALVDEMRRAKEATAYGYDVPEMSQAPGAASAAGAPVKVQPAGDMTFDEQYQSAKEFNRRRRGQ